MIHDSSNIELTILLPCRNEAETIGTCIKKAMDYLARSRVRGELLVADNESTDSSPQIAMQLGARVITVTDQGYGAALIGGIAKARGRYVIMGDADDSYDLSQLDSFVTKLQAGNDLVVGNRFKGDIAPGAMPLLHRWLGNPALSFLGRLFFGIKIGDFHCGLRGFRTETLRGLNLTTRGMEFASEMVVRSALAGLSITEVPTKLSRDGRSRRPHLRTWYDGWRHLRFLLLFCPRWLFLYPGLFLLALGVLLSTILLPGPVSIAPNVTLDIHTLIVGATTMLIGMQCVSFAIIVRRYAAARGFLPMTGPIDRLLSSLTLERVLLVAAMVGLFGASGVTWCVVQWAATGFGPLHYAENIRILTISMAVVALALQLGFTAFLSAILEMRV